MILSRILYKAGVKAEEKTVVLWCMLHAIATGSFIPIIVSVPMALFLSKFGSASLSYGFIANAILTLLMGAIYVSFEKKVLFSKLQFGVVSCIVTTLFLCWLGVSVISASWIFAVILILSWTIFDFAFFEFWCVLNRLFNLQQAKRLFGLIGGVRATSGIITGVSSPFLIKLLGLNQLLLIAAVGSFFSLVALYNIKKLYPEKLDQQGAEEQDDEMENNKGLNFSKALHNKYFLSIFIFSILMMFINLNFDILWNTVAEEHYPDQNKLAVFFSIFSAILSGSQILFSFISAPILKHFGVIKALLFQPLVLLIIGMMTFVVVLITPKAPAIFFGVLVMYLFYTSYSSSIRAPSMLVLFQPLLQQDRSWIQSKLEAVIYPVATGVAGLIMLLVTNTIGISVKILLLPLLVLSALFFIITYSLKTGYIAALIKALTKPYLIQPNFDTLDKNILPILQQKLESPFPEEVLYVLGSLEKLDTIEYQQILRKALDSEHEAIRKHVIAQFIHYPHPELLEKIRIMAVSDVSSEVRALAYQVLASSNEDCDIEFVLSGLNHSDSMIKWNTIRGVIKYLKSYFALARDKLLFLGNSDVSEDRQLAAHVIGDNRITELLPQLLSLTKDDDLHVQAAAIIALGEMKNKSALIEILQTAPIDLLSAAIIKSLIAGGADLINELTPIFTDLKSNAQCLIVRAASYMDHCDASLNLLKEHMAIDDLTVRFYILTALTKKAYHAKGGEAVNVEALISQECHSILFYRSKLAIIPDEPLSLVLKEFFQRFIELAKERLLMLLSFIYDPSELIKVKMALKSKDADKVSYALEMLDVTLLPKHKTHILALFVEPELSSHATDFNGLLQEILENKDKLFNKWLSVTTLYYVGKNKMSVFLPLLTSYASSSEMEIKETAEWAINEL